MFQQCLISQQNLQDDNKEWKKVFFIFYNMLSISKKDSKIINNKSKYSQNYNI